jgi:hypothetical protein
VFELYLSWICCSGERAELRDQSQCVKYDMNQFMAKLNERTSASHVQCKEKIRSA